MGGKSGFSHVILPEVKAKSMLQLLSKHPLVFRSTPARIAPYALSTAKSARLITFSHFVYKDLSSRYVGIRPAKNNWIDIACDGNSDERMRH